jgi:hypothetical protein
VTADVHAIDVAGRYGTGFLLAGTAAGGNQEIIVNPRTCQFRGYQFLGNGRTSMQAARGAWPSSARRSSPRPECAHLDSPNPATHDTWSCTTGQPLRGRCGLGGFTFFIGSG